MLQTIITAQMMSDGGHGVSWQGGSLNTKLVQMQLKPVNSHPSQ